MKNSKNSGYTKENLKDEVMAKSSVQTEDEVIVIDISEAEIIDDFPSLDLRKPGKYYITDKNNIGEAYAYFGYTSDGKYPKYVAYSAGLTGASVFTMDVNDTKGQMVGFEPKYNRETYIEVFDRTVRIYQLFEI